MLLCHRQPRLATLMTMSGIRWDGTDQRRGGTTAATIIAVIVDDGGGSVGADDQHSMPHAAKERPGDNVATIVVGFPPSSAPPRNPFPSSVSLYSSWLSYASTSSYLLMSLSSSNRHSPSPVVFPPSPPLPLPSCHHPQSNASANPSGSLNMYNPWSACRMLIARSAESLPNDGPV